jgi:hypothetical protein
LRARVRAWVRVEAEGGGWLWGKGLSIRLPASRESAYARMFDTKQGHSKAPQNA